MIELIFSLLGFVLGIALAINSPEELKPGKKYFKFARNVLFSLIILFLVVLIVNQFYLIFNFNYPIIILASLIFLYGLPAGTLFRLKQIEKKEKKYL